MAELHVISALRAKHAELAGELRQTEQRAAQLRSDLEAIDRSIVIFDPTAQPQNIPAKTRRQSTSTFRHGEFARNVRDLLRQAGAPLSLSEIADRIATKHNLNMDASDSKAKLIANEVDPGNWTGG
jgi:hypothetical protein